MDREVAAGPSGGDGHVRREGQARLAIEEVELVERQDEVDDVARANPVLRPDDADDVLVGRRDVKQLLVAEVLDDVGGARERSPVRAGLANVEMLWAEARDERLAALRGGRVAVASGQRDRPVGGADEWGAAAGAVDLHVDEIHRRAADEPCDEPVDRGVVEGLRGADLLEDALAHHGDPLAHRHRLDLVVGDVDDGRLESLVEPRDLGAGLDAQLGVEVRERLVHQEDGRLTDDRATEGDALPLAAGQLLRLAIEQLLELDGLGCLVDAAVDLGLRDLAQLEPEREVLPNGHVRIERVALEDHRDVAILGRDVVHDPIADPQHAGGDLLEPCDHPETRRLAAARWPDQDHELAVADLQVQVLHGVEIAVDLVDVLERHGSHASTSTPTDHRGPMHPATEMDSDGPRTWTARRPGIVRPSHPGRNADQARPRVRSINLPRTFPPSARKPLWTNSSVIQVLRPRMDAAVSSAKARST